MKRLHGTIRLRLLLLIALFPFWIQPRMARGQQSDGDSTVLQGVNVIRGTGTDPVGPWMILIRNGRIAEVGPDVEVPEDAERIELGGMTVLPGLVDMHGHLYANVGGKLQSEFDAYSKLYLAGGVTTIFTPGEFDPIGAAVFRDAVRNGEAVGPDIVFAGPYFDNAPSSLGWIEGTPSVEAVTARFDQWRSRIDAVKVYTRITETQLTTLIASADRFGLFVTGHLASVSAGRAAQLGIHGIEHGIFSFSEFWSQGATTWDQICDLAKLNTAGDRAVALMEQLIEAGVYLDPTIVAWQAVLPDFSPVVPNWESYLTPEAALAFRRFWANVIPGTSYVECMERALDRQLDFVNAFHERGGIVVVGTDPVAPLLIPGYGLHREVSLLVEAGLTPLEAIKAATFDAAVALGLDDEIGSIHSGKWGNLVVIDGDPTEDIAALGRTVMVFKRGLRFDPAELRESAKGIIGSP